MLFATEASAEFVRLIDGNNTVRSDLKDERKNDFNYFAILYFHLVALCAYTFLELKFLKRKLNFTHAFSSFFLKATSTILYRSHVSITKIIDNATCYDCGDLDKSDTT